MSITTEQWNDFIARIDRMIEKEHDLKKYIAAHEYTPQTEKEQMHKQIELRIKHYEQRKQEYAEYRDKK